MACVEGRYFAGIAAKFRMCGYMAGRVPWFGQWSHGPISRCYLEPLHHLLLLLRLRCFGIRDGVNGDDMVQCWLHLLILPWRDMELMDGSTARGHLFEKGESSRRLEPSYLRADEKTWYEVMR
jgi:hypothetical protein